MNTYLLTGCGVQPEFGGWLADEAFEYLLGCSELLPYHRTLLWKHRGKGGFESVLQELRDEYIKSPGHHSAKPLQEFDKLLMGMFYSMNNAFGSFEPVKNPVMGPQPTLMVRFSVSLRRNLYPQPRHPAGAEISPIRYPEGSQGKLFGALSPGLLEENIAGQPYAHPGLFRPADPPYSVPENFQPYFKLHGSSHWRALNGMTLLIMADNKGNQIDGVALLDWYRNEFRTRL